MQDVNELILVSSCVYRAGAAYSDGVNAVITRSPLLRGAYFFLGLLSLGLLFISALPGIPTADMAFLAAFFFAKSSDRLHSWIVTHPRFGPMIENFDPRTGYSRKTKITGITMVALSFTLSVALINIMWLRVMMVLLALGICAYIWTRHEQEREPAPV